MKGDYDSSGSLLRRYVHGPGVDEYLVMYTGSGTANRSYYHANHQGSIVAMSDGNGTVTETHAYSPYGLGEGDDTGNPFRYTGRRLDAETGLYYYRARYYSPAIGRFLQTDPIGYGDGLNWYAYVGNDPVNLNDATGEDAYVVARRLDSFVGKLGYGHAYVVSNAQYVGDPNATVHSYGKLNNGNMGNVTDSSRAADISSDTFDSDKAHWQSLARDTTDNISQINAPDTVVDDVAGAVQENDPYGLLPASKDQTPGGRTMRNTPETNSNSAAFSVGDTSQQIETGNNNSQVNRTPFKLTLPGENASKKVEVNKKKIKVCTTGSRICR